MTAQRAYSLGIRARDCYTRTTVNHYGGAWLVIWRPDNRIVTQFTPNDGAFFGPRFINELERLECS